MTFDKSSSLQPLHHIRQRYREPHRARMPRVLTLYSFGASDALQVQRSS